MVPEMAAPEVKRSRRLFGALLGTLAQFRKEDEAEKSSDAHMKRVTSLKRVGYASVSSHKRFPSFLVRPVLGLELRGSRALVIEGRCSAVLCKGEKWESAAVA